MELDIEPWRLDSTLEVVHFRLTDSCLAALEAFATLANDKNGVILELLIFKLENFYLDYETHC